METDNIFEVGVSYFHTLKTEVPVTAELYDLLTTDRFRDEVTAVRNAKDLATKGNLKNALPSYTPSGTFGSWGYALLLKPTGLICVDIDKKENLQVEDFADLKDRLSKVPYIAYCGLSCGGEGYFCIIPIADHYLFRHHFHSLQMDFAAMGITIDEKCSDVGRKRFVSYDPDPWINHQPTIYEGLVEVPRWCSNKSPVSGVTFDNADVALVDRYIDLIVEKKLDITYLYHNWLRIAYAFANTFGEAGRERFHKVSQFYDYSRCDGGNKYNPKETDELYDSALRGNSPNPVTIKTFFFYARERGLDAEISLFEPVL